MGIVVGTGETNVLPTALEENRGWVLVKKTVLYNNFRLGPGMTTAYACVSTYLGTRWNRPMDTGKVV